MLEAHPSIFSNLQPNLRTPPCTFPEIQVEDGQDEGGRQKHGDAEPDGPLGIGVHEVISREKGGEPQQEPRVESAHEQTDVLHQHRYQTEKEAREYGDACENKIFNYKNCRVF